VLVLIPQWPTIGYGDVVLAKLAHPGAD